MRVEGFLDPPGQWIAIVPFSGVLHDQPLMLPRVSRESEIPPWKIASRGNRGIKQALLCDPHHKTPFALEAEELADILQACSFESLASLAQGSYVYPESTELICQAMHYDVADFRDHACFAMGQRLVV